MKVERTGVKYLNTAPKRDNKVENSCFDSGRIKMFDDFDFTGFWNEDEFYYDEYTEEPPTDEQIARVERELGYRLPQSYIWLMKNQRNGGAPNNTCIKTAEATGWADSYAEITAISGIGSEKLHSLCSDLGSQFMIDEWGYPDIGVAICDTPSAGHDMVFLDYSECGREGEPRVVYIEQESDYRITPLADNFEQFIRSLVSGDELKAERETRKSQTVIQKTEKEKRLSWWRRLLVKF